MPAQVYSRSLYAIPALLPCSSIRRGMEGNRHLYSCLCSLRSQLLPLLSPTTTQGCENADKCAWTFGSTYITGSGAKANMKLGAYDYLIQQVRLFHVCRAPPAPAADG
jgi:hypothetical protein